MAWGRVIDVWQNAETGVLYDSAGSNLKSASFPKMYYLEQVLLRLRIVTSVSGSVFTTYKNMTGTDVLQTVIDNDWTHWITGALTAGFSGTITSMTVDGLSEDPPSTGNLKPTNAAGETETIPYSSWTSSNSVYTFTLPSIALTYIYLENDVTKATEGLIVKTENSGINVAGDWTSGATADITDGQISIRLDGSSTVYQAAVEGLAKIASPFLEIQVKNASAQLKELFTFTFACHNIRDDDGAIPSRPSSGFLTTTTGDARYNNTIVATQATLTDNATTNITLGANATFRAYIVEAVIDDGTLYQIITFKLYFVGAVAKDPIIDYAGDDITTLEWTTDIDSGNLRLKATVTSHGSNLKMVYAIREMFNVSV